MAQHPRIFIPGETYELVLPVVAGEPRLEPTTQVKRLLDKLLAALSRSPLLQLHAAAGVGTHLHLLVTPLHTLAIPAALRDFKGTAAKCLNKLQGRRGALWRPYRETPVSKEGLAQLARLRYVLRHGEKEGLVADVAESPYVNSARQLLGLEPPDDDGPALVPLSVMAPADETTRQRAVQELLRRDLDDEAAVAAAWEVLVQAGCHSQEEFPSVANLPAEVEQFRQARIERNEERARRRRRRDVGAATPAPDRKSARRPQVHAASAEVRTAWTDTLFAIRDAYRAASARFRAGDAKAEFPPWTLRPPGWNSGWESAVAAWREGRNEPTSLAGR